jgi:hypothetical protein
MEFFLFFIVAGVLMYILDVVLLRMRDHITLTSYLLSGTIVGIGFGLLTNIAYPAYKFFWMFPVVTMSGSTALYVFAKYDFYKYGFIQLFGTITLGLLTGLFAFVVFNIFLIGLSFQQTNLSILDMIIYGFLIHFGYSFVGRFHKKRKQKKITHAEKT